MSRSFFWTLIGSIFLTILIAIPSPAQLPSITELNFPKTTEIWSNSDSQIKEACVRLDGRCLFRLADRRSELSKRLQDVEQRLYDVGKLYFRNETDILDISKRPAGKLQDIYVSIGKQAVRLLSVTSLDAQIRGVDITTRANQIIEKIEIGLARGKQERQTEYLIRQGIFTIGIAVILLIANVALAHYLKHFRRSKAQLAPQHSSPGQPISTQLNQRQQWHLQQLWCRLLQLAQMGVFLGGSIAILYLFPQTRILQVWIILLLRIPLRVGIVVLVTYVLIRLSYALINRFTSVITRNTLLTPEANLRLQQRVTTILGVSKGIVTVSWVIIGILAALSLIGVNIAPVLAGAGIIGLAVSLASQNLIKDAINGFLIIIEDQYAIGDLITVGEVSGLVENLNLRMTQLRDNEGRLITLPNSEIKIVANHSSSWSRADLNIPVAYHTDVNLALELISQVAQSMSEEPQWQNLILETPRILGVDDFAERSMTIRLWIKTKPLKQWDVSREFRRRIKIALDEAGIPIPIPQQEIWFNRRNSEQ